LSNATPVTAWTTTLKRATEPFLRQGAGRGTGLGFSMVDGLVAQSGGAMPSPPAIASTTVELWLPGFGGR
jgi:signal transduction histidine kinase